MKIVRRITLSLGAAGVLAFVFGIGAYILRDGLSAEYPYHSCYRTCAVNWFAVLWSLPPFSVGMLIIGAIAAAVEEV